MLGGVLLGVVLLGAVPLGVVLLLSVGFCLGVSLFGASAGGLFGESVGVVPEGLVAFEGSEEAGALVCWPHPDKIVIKLVASKMIKLLLSHDLVMSKSSLRLKFLSIDMETAPLRRAAVSKD